MLYFRVIVTEEDDDDYRMKKNVFFDMGSFIAEHLALYYVKYPINYHILCRLPCIWEKT